MSVGILTGGNRIFSAVGEGTKPRSGLGVFGKHPGATPKYALNRGPRHSDRKESMARLFIEVPSGYVDKFMASVPAESRDLARVLVSGGESNGSGGTGFIDFLLTSTNENFQEKAQVVDTLTDNFVAFYAGQEPPRFRYSGQVLNTYQDDQRVWLLRLYRDILRGTRLAGRQLTAKLRYDSFVVVGYLESLQLGLRGATEIAGSFTFTFLAKEMHVWTPSLARPTQVSTPVTEGSVFSPSSSEQNDANARAATLSADSPENPSGSPAAGNSDDELDPREQEAREYAEEAIQKMHEQSDALNEQAELNDAFQGTTNIRNLDFNDAERERMRKEADKIRRDDPLNQIAASTNSARVRTTEIRLRGRSYKASVDRR